MRFIKLLPPAKRRASCFHYAISRDIRDIFLVRRVVFNEGKVDTPVPVTFFIAFIVAFAYSSLSMR